jgi:protein-S-isoprenylcysteine O-methyltransferase Ste14
MRSVVLLSATALLALGVWGLLEFGTQRQGLGVGAALVLIGLPLVALARHQLGKAFAVTPQAKGLVTHGLYARIPHPIYVFLDVVLLGAILMLGKAWLLIPWAGLVIVQVWQARREAAVLEQAFGDAYREYRKRTWW